MNPDCFKNDKNWFSVISTDQFKEWYSDSERSLTHDIWDFPAKNTGVGCHFLLQGIFPTQGSNLCLLHFRQILYHLSLQGRALTLTPPLSSTWVFIFLFNLKIKKKNIGWLFLTALGLHGCALAFSSCSEWQLLLVAGLRLLLVVASLVVEHGLQGTRA